MAAIPRASSPDILAYAPVLSISTTTQLEKTELRDKWVVLFFKFIHRGTYYIFNYFREEYDVYHFHRVEKMKVKINPDIILEKVYGKVRKESREENKQSNA